MLVKNQLMLVQLSGIILRTRGQRKISIFNFFIILVRIDIFSKFVVLSSSFGLRAGDLMFCFPLAHK